MVAPVYGGLQHLAAVQFAAGDLDSSGVNSGEISLLKLFIYMKFVYAIVK